MQRPRGRPRDETRRALVAELVPALGFSATARALNCSIANVFTMAKRIGVSSPNAKGRPRKMPARDLP